MKFCHYNTPVEFFYKFFLGVLPPLGNLKAKWRPQWRKKVEESYM
jgi:hypothetical protein